MINWDNFREERQRLGKPFVIAHRGVRAQVAENTLRGFQLALEQGAFVLETDLHFTKDDEIVLHHDPTVDRMTDGEGYVRDYTLDELQKLRTIDPQSGQPCDDRIPTLVELIESTNAQTPLLLELKDPLFQDRVYARKLIDTLTESGMLQSCALVSFQQVHVNTTEALCSAIPTGNITMTQLFPQRNIELLGPVWPILYANPFYVKWAHSWGSIVCPLDTTPEKRIGYYLWLDVDALLTDDPAATIRAMER